MARATRGRFPSMKAGRLLAILERADVERWSAAASSYPEVRKLAEEGIAFALEREVGQVELEHYVPADEPAAV